MVPIPGSAKEVLEVDKNEMINAKFETLNNIK